MKHTKRILSVLICLAMVLSLLSVVSFAAAPSKLYLKPNSNWTQANARFAAYFFGNGNQWVSCTPVAGASGIYEVEVPAGFTSVIFCRMNPSNSNNDWNNKWNQTGDLTIPTDGKNCFTVQSGAWDGATTTWGSYTPPACDHAGHGQDGLCGKCGQTVEHSFVNHVCSCGLEEPMIAEPGYYLVGKFGGTEFWFVNETSADRMFSATEDENVLEIVYTFAVGDEYKIVSYDGYGNITWPDGDNLVVNEAGELTMRFEPATGKSYFYHGCDHLEHDADGNCTSCGEAVGHSYDENYACTCGKTIELITIYFQNNWNWSNVQIHYWDSLMGGTEWPGVAMDVYAGNIFKYPIPSDAKFLINGLDNGAEKKTPDITEGIADGNCYYMEWSEELGEHVLVDSIENMTPACAHEAHGQDGICVDCGENVGHSFDADHNCSCGLVEELVSEAGYYLVGSLGGGDFWFVDSAAANRLFSASAEEGIYEITYNFAAGDEFKVVEFDGYVIKTWYPEGDNLTSDIDGERTVIFNTTTGEIYFYSECAHEAHDQDGNCTNCGEAVGHSYVDGTCGICGAADPDYVPPCDHVEHDVDGNCTNCGEYVGHNYDGYTCTDCGKTVEDITIFFQNNWLWSEVSIYFWGSEVEEDANWPGRSMSFYDNDGTFDIYSCKIPSDVRGILINGKKDDGSGNLDQTPDIKEGIRDGVCYAMAWDNGNIAVEVDLNNLLCDHVEHDTDGICTNCGTTVAHTAGDVVVEKVVTGDCYTDSSYDNVTYCTICNVEISRETITTPAAHGEITHVEAVAATCYTDGNIEYWYCKDCGQAWLDESCTLNTNLKAVVLPMGHGEITHVEAVAATCYEDGNIEYWYCKDCGQAWLDADCTLNTNLKAVVLPMGHGEITHVEAVAATCYTDGNIEYWYCEACGQAWLDADCTRNTNLKSVILPMGHGDIIHVEATAATCYTDGNIEYWYCEACGQAWLDADCTRNTNLKSVILPKGHGDIIHVEAVAATCYTDGNIEYWYCETCGQAWLDADCTRNTNLKSVILPSQGHSFADGFCGNCGEADPDYVPPVEKPIKVENLTMVSNTRSSITVSWDAFDGAENYWLFLDGAAYNCTAGTTMTITGRQVATAYEIYVLAVMDDGSMLKAADADVLTAETKDYELSGYAYSEGRDIHVEWEADGCNRAWMLYGTNADDLIVYDESNDGTFTKANLKIGTTYYVQIAYLIDNKVIYGEIMEVYVFSNTEFIPI